MSHVVFRPHMRLYRNTRHFAENHTNLAAQEVSMCYLRLNLERLAWPILDHLYEVVRMNETNQ